MKFITDRKELAKEMNIKRTPVLTINITKCMDGYDNCYSGSDIEIQHPRANDLFCRCTVKMFSDGPNEDLHDTPWLYKSIALYEGVVCIDSSFGLSDVREMAHWNNVRRAKEGDEVLVFFDGGATGWVRKMKIGPVSANVFPLARLVDVE